LTGAAEELQRLQDFNTHLGKYRIRVEQGIGQLKLWMAASGVSSTRLRFDLGTVVQRVELVAALVNFTQTIRRHGVFDPVSTRKRKAQRDDDWFIPLSKRMNSTTSN
jgi:hypothetical protein